MKVHEHMMLGVVSCALVVASMAGCATPAGDAPPSASKGVAAICQNVMGLSPNERLTGGNWLGNDKLDYWTSHYRTCVSSLSDSVQDARDTQVVQQAEEGCRAKGLLPGSPDLALCVLNAANKHPEPAASGSAASSQAAANSAGTSLAAAGPTNGGDAGLSDSTVPPGSFYFASTSEIARRERVACAALGLSPAQAEFKGCVQQLRSTFYAIDHPID